MVNQQPQNNKINDIVAEEQPDQNLKPMTIINLVRAASQGDKYEADEPLSPDALPALFRKTSQPLKQNIKISDLLLASEQDEKDEVPIDTGVDKEEEVLIDTGDDKEEEVYEPIAFCEKTH